MSQYTHQPRQLSPIRALLAAGILTTIAAFGAAQVYELPVQARLVRKQQDYPWVSITSQQVMSGATIPADSNVIFHLPQTFERINREVLLGLKGKRVRYWGYCFPENEEPETISKRTGFPGLLFLSEAERAARLRQEELAKPRFTVNNLPTDEQIETLQSDRESIIRHQLEVFKPATLCYIMAAEPLAIGLDKDGDRLNDKLERELGTKVDVNDSDGDGIQDGIEVQTGTRPDIRDTDADGIIDGIEDADWDGRIDIRETDPKNRDTDRDGLCDGLCREKLKNNFIYMGEDQNLDGVMDAKETDPRKADSDGDGKSDELEFLACIAANKTTCP